LEPTILFLIGLPASGKSTIGKRIASEYNFCYLDKDIVCNHFTGMLLELKGASRHDREGSFYNNVLMDLEYKTLLNIADDNLKLGKSVIVDAPFINYLSNSNYIEELRGIYDWRDVNIIVVSVNIDFAILKTRMIERSLDRDKWKLANWDAYLQSIQKKQCCWKNIRIIQFDNSYLSIDTQNIQRIFQQ
jgi:predicted kinase